MSSDVSGIKVTNNEKGHNYSPNTKLLALQFSKFDTR